MAVPTLDLKRRRGDAGGNAEKNPMRLVVWEIAQNGALTTRRVIAESDRPCRVFGWRVSDPVTMPFSRAASSASAIGRAMSSASCSVPSMAA
jgi:hypothetical protein